MNRRELVAAIGAHTDLDNKTVDAALKGFVDVVQATIVKGEPVVMSGFAKFARVDRRARMGRNPATGQPIKIKASRKVRVTPLKGLKDVGSGAVKPLKLQKVAPAKKAPAKKAPAKKAAAKKAPARRVAARK